jgi:uncharacterized RDD family membrane protein YckC
MFCSRCGHQSRDTGSFCANCGAPMNVPIGGGAVEQTWPGIATPPVPYAPETASWGRRFGAWIIDGLIASIIALIPGLALALVIGALVAAGQTEAFTFAEQQAQDDELENAIITGFYLGWIPAYFGYYWITNALGGGPGKRMLGMRIIGVTDGAKPGFGRGFVRALVSIFSRFFYLGYLWALWDDEHRTWHDHASDTVVVYTR